MRLVEFVLDILSQFYKSRSFAWCNHYTAFDNGKMVSHHSREGAAIAALSASEMHSVDIATQVGLLPSCSVQHSAKE